MRASTRCGRAVTLGILALAACCLQITFPDASVHAQDLSVQSVVARAEIQDLITRYYYNFGHESPESFGQFYADDAELILGDKHFKGRDGIAKAYSNAGQNTQIHQAYSFTVTISNPLVTVHGDSATSKLVFTEYLITKQGEAPTIRTQGREYATFVKERGQWRYKTRQIMSGMDSPKDWKE